MFIIPCKYSEKSNYITTLIGQIRKFHPYELIMVVDSASEYKNYFEELKKYNVIIADINNKHWMIGAYWYGFKSFPNEEFYYCIHDSINIKDNLDYLKNKDLTLLANFNRTESPKFNAWNEKIKNETLIDKIYIKNNGKGCYGPIFCCKNKILRDLVNLKCDNILPNNKEETWIMEGAFGLFFEALGYNLNECTLYGDILELESAGGKSGLYPHNTSWQYPIEKFYASHVDDTRHL